MLNFFRNPSTPATIPARVAEVPRKGRNSQAVVSSKGHGVDEFGFVAEFCRQGGDEFELRM